jgi:3-hydroxymyristoyl/3-hydroxydecanoyl-(acyl carrier protein) dehydratase
MRFLMVDHITGWSETDAIRAVKNVAMSEDFLEHHFPGRPVMPGALLLEALSQLAGWMEAASSDFEHWLVVDSVERCGYYGFALPGDQVELELRPRGEITDGRRSYRGLGTVAGETKIKADFSGRIVALAEIADPDSHRRLFNTLRRETSW